MRGAMWTCTDRDIQTDIHRNRKTDKRKKNKDGEHRQTEADIETERQKDKQSAANICVPVRNK